MTTDYQQYRQKKVAEADALFFTLQQTDLYTIMETLSVYFSHSEIGDIDLCELSDELKQKARQTRRANKARKSSPV